MSGTLIDAAARVDPQARIGAGVAIGPFCTVGPQVTLGEGVRLAPGVHVSGYTTIGAGTRVAPFSSLGGPPQSTRYRGGPTALVIGSDCDIREHVTINTGTEDGGGTTMVGDRCMLMVGSHIAHDCRIGNDVIFANNVVLGGHVSVGDFAVLGGVVAVHQFVRIGEGAMIGGMSGVEGDVIPFAMAMGARARLRGVNIVGMKRRGRGREEIRRVWRVYRALFHGEATFEQRRVELEREFKDDPLIGKIFDFIRAGDYRSLMRAQRTAAATGAGDVDS
ncbi:MAG: acyl-ACP--UDP-N-acetylglucosamine O-acyltransferase [Hyphomicrobiales bacterium]|nr:acyl-ACP--UDP-N-acetylglucosamine O-acyltransferase [Hyphomicrobiales bacterium]